MGNTPQLHTEQEYYKHLGAQLRRMRQSQGLSQSALATKIGITFQQLQKYETGQDRITVFRLRQLTAVLEVSMARFFENEFKNVPCFIPDSKKINAHITTIRNELTAIKQALMCTE